MKLLPTERTPPVRDLRDLSAAILGPPKIGKSGFCAQMEDALFLATEPGLNALDVYQVPVTSWKELRQACAELASGAHSFRTVILDTTDNAYRMCAAHTCKKHGIEHESDLGYGKGFHLVQTEFHRVLTRLAFLPYGLYLVGHIMEKEILTRTGRQTRIVPALPDKAAKIVLGLVDLVLFFDVETTVENGKSVTRRVIRTKPTALFEAGDRTGRLPETLPLDYHAFVEAFYGQDG